MDYKSGQNILIPESIHFDSRTLIPYGIDSTLRLESKSERDFDSNKIEFESMESN